MRNSLINKVAIVTGASRGIGRGIALRLAAEGAAVALVSRGREVLGRSLTGTAAEIEALGGRVLAISADLSEKSFAPDVIFDRVEAEFGAVDVLVNNCGQIAYSNFLEQTIDDFEEMVRVNVSAPWRLCQRALPSMAERGQGWILNIGSAAGQPDHPATAGMACYGGTKAMLMAATRCFAAEVAGTGVAVNVLVTHGAVMTEQVTGWMEEGALDRSFGESMETMVEAALALCTTDPNEHHGGVWRSDSLLMALGRPARTLDGGAVAAGGSLREIEASIVRIDEAIASLTEKPQFSGPVTTHS